MKSRESVASCCEGKTCASSRHSRKPAFQLQEGKVNSAQTLQEFEQMFSKKKLERPKAGLSRGIPTLWCAAFSNVFFARSGAGRPVRGARLSRGIPTLECAAFSNVFFARSGAGTPTPRTTSCTCFSVPRRAKHARNHLNGRRQCLLHRQKRKQRTKKDRK